MLAPVVTVVSTTSITIQLSWTSSGQVVDKYEVTWERDTSGECPYIDKGNAIITNNSTSYTIKLQEEGGSYVINVRATNAAGSIISLPVIVRIVQIGEELVT